MGSLANVLFHQHCPDDTNKSTLEPLEIQLGIQKIAQGLQFLHQKAKLVHLNIAPESIYVTKSGEWKISGFAFSTNPTSVAPSSSPSSSTPNLIETNSPTSTESIEHIHFPVSFDFKLKEIPQEPNLDYSAPEVVGQGKASVSSDAFSLGVLLFNCHRKEEALISAKNSVSKYKEMVGQSSYASFFHLPASLQDILPQLIKVDPNSRLREDGLLSSSYFSDLPFRTLMYLENFVEKDPMNKSQFLKGLHQILPQFSTKIQVTKILPKLANEMKTSNLLTFLIPNILLIGDKMDKTEFSSKISSLLVPLLPTLKDQIPTLLMLLDNIEIIMSKSSLEMNNSHFFNFVVSCFGINRVDVITSLLRNLPKLFPFMDLTQLKSVILPKIMSATSSANSNPIRVLCLLCFQKLLLSMDKETIISQIIPALEKLTNIEKSVDIVKHILGCWESISKKLSDEQIANILIPKVAPLMFDSEISLDLFHHLTKLLRDMIDRIEVNRMRTLQERQDLAVDSPVVTPTVTTPIDDNPLRHLTEAMASSSTATTPKITTSTYIAPVLTPSTVASSPSQDFDFGYSTQQQQTTILPSNPPLQPPSQPHPQPKIEENSFSFGFPSTTKSTTPQPQNSFDSGFLSSVRLSQPPPSSTSSLLLSSQQRSLPSPTTTTATTTANTSSFSFGPSPPTTATTRQSDFGFDLSSSMSNVKPSPQAQTSSSSVSGGSKYNIKLSEFESTIPINAYEPPKPTHPTVSAPSQSQLDFGFTSSATFGTNNTNRVAFSSSLQNGNVSNVNPSSDFGGWNNGSGHVNGSSPFGFDPFANSKPTMGATNTNNSFQASTDFFGNPTSKSQSSGTKSGSLLDF